MAGTEPSPTSHLHGIRFIALRFFAVYGPRQRPDLAIHKFARLDARGAGRCRCSATARLGSDSTFIDDIVAGIRAAIAYRGSPYEVINLGNNQTLSLADMIRSLETALDVSATIQRLPEQPGDLPQDLGTY